MACSAACVPWPGRKIQRLGFKWLNWRRGWSMLRGMVDEMSKRVTVHDFVTHEELAGAIDRATARIGGDLDRKFQAQSNAVNSLRAMISQTDVLLQRVLDGIENSESEARLV